MRKIESRIFILKDLPPLRPVMERKKYERKRTFCIEYDEEKSLRTTETNQYGSAVAQSKHNKDMEKWNDIGLSIGNQVFKQFKTQVWVSFLNAFPTFRRHRHLGRKFADEFDGRFLHIGGLVGVGQSQQNGAILNRQAL